MLISTRSAGTEGGGYSQTAMHFVVSGARPCTGKLSAP